MKNRWSAPTARREEIQEEGARLVFEGYTQGFDLTRLVSHRFPLEQAVEAIRVASNPSAQSMKIIIEAGG